MDFLTCNLVLFIFYNDQAFQFTWPLKLFAFQVLIQFSTTYTSKTPEHILLMFV